MFDKLIQSLKGRTGLIIIITAALLLELLSGSQYYLTRRMVSEELEKRAESELTLKAILIKNALNSAEDILKNHIWDIRENLAQPDSVHEAIGRMIMLSRSVHGGAMSFVPDYYPTKGRLFEPYALKDGDSIVKSQIAGPHHDYTERIHYQKAIEAGKAVWIEPYEDMEGAQTSVISYVMPVHDKSNALVGVAGVDVSLEWLSDTIDSRHTYPSSFVLLLTADGKPIIQPSENRVNREATSYIIHLINDSTVARQKSNSGRSTLIHFDTDKRDGTVFYANMKGNPKWQIATVCYDDEVYASLSRIRLFFLLLMSLAFGILLFMIYRFARNEKKLQSKTLKEERMAGELRIANDIQQALLPTDEESNVGFDDVSVEGRLIPAKAVGGDLYNAFVRDGKLFFCIGDVSGKGIPSALIMAITQTLFRNIASRENNPAHIMSLLNDAACRNNKTNVFITLFIGVLDLPTGHLRYCNAGHELPIFINHKNQEQEQGIVSSEAATSSLQFSKLEAKPNLPIGLFNDFNYEMQEMTMQPESTLFLYTDGLTEARNEQNKMLGRARMMQMISECGTTSTKQLVEMVVEQVKEFSKNAEQSDDLTLLAISYIPKEVNYILDEELTLQNDVKEVEKLSAFIKQTTERLNIEKSLAYQLRLALEEAVVNVMEYAYPAGTTGDVNIRVTSDGKHLKFIISDSGISFNPTEASTADTTLSAEERPVGGLGIFLVRELMDSINYERIDGKNVLTLSKKIEK
ncbi:MAG: SpoIIE family protein phosphatase [Prevotella sp.]|nr:SpoIIE family protein phosphatase [Prevotella sp.]